MTNESYPQIETGPHWKRAFIGWGEISNCF